MQARTCSPGSRGKPLPVPRATGRNPPDSRASSSTLPQASMPSRKSNPLTSVPPPRNSVNRAGPRLWASGFRIGREAAIDGRRRHRALRPRRNGFRAPPAFRNGMPPPGRPGTAKQAATAETQPLPPFLLRQIRERNRSGATPPGCPDPPEGIPPAANTPLPCVARTGVAWTPADSLWDNCMEAKRAMAAFQCGVVRAAGSGRILSNNSPADAGLSACRAESKDSMIGSHSGPGSSSRSTLPREYRSDFMKSTSPPPCQSSGAM